MVGLAPAHLMDFDCRRCVRSPRTVAYKRRRSRLWATAQPRLSYVWTDPRTKTDQARVRFGTTVDRDVSRTGAKMPAWPVVKYRDRFSFQGSRSLALLRLQRLIPLDKGGASMPVARARVGSQFHRRSRQTGPRPASGVDDRHQLHAPPQMKDDGAARSRRRALRQLHQVLVVSAC